MFSKLRRTNRWYIQQAWTRSYHITCCYCLLNCLQLVIFVTVAELFYVLLIGTEYESYSIIFISAFKRDNINRTAVQVWAPGEAYSLSALVHTLRSRDTQHSVNLKVLLMGVGWVLAVVVLAEYKSSSCQCVFIFIHSFIKSLQGPRILTTLCALEGFSEVPQRIWLSCNPLCCKIKSLCCL